MDYSMPTEKIITLEPSNIENIDYSMFEWVEGLELSTNTNSGYKKAPVLWLGTERTFQIKSNKDIRDSVGKLKLPLITVNRDSIEKDPNFKGGFQAHFKEEGDYGGGAITISRRIKKDKTRNHNNAKKARQIKTGDQTGRNHGGRPVYEEITMPTPSYITVMYNITLRTEYQQQMNDLVAPFIAKTGNINSFLLKRNGWMYEAFVQQSFTENKNVENLSEEERRFETKIQIKVLGILVGEGANREKPKITIRQTQTQIKITRERVLVGEDRPWAIYEKDYREL
jgi:hypothetical protein